MFYVVGMHTLVQADTGFAIPTDTYGKPSIKSSRGSFNLHGNILESFFGILHRSMPSYLQQKP